MGLWKTSLRIAMVLAILVPALAACSDTQVIRTTTGAVSLSIQVVGGSGRYDVATLQFTALQYRPADPQFADMRMGLVTAPINLDLSRTDVIQVLVGLPTGNSQPLTAGDYEVFQAKLVQFSFLDEAPLMPGATCVQQVATPLVALDPGNVTQPLANALFDFDPPVRFTIGPGTTQLRLLIDGPGIIDMLERQFACQFTTCNFSGATVPPPCIPLQGFTEPSSSQIEPFFTIESIS